MRRGEGVQVWLGLPIMKPILCLPLISILLAGCASPLVTQKLDSVSPSGSKFKGVVYYLPEGKLHVDIAWGKDASEWSVKVTAAIQPDTRQRYYLHGSDDPLFSGTGIMMVNSQGLLQTAVSATPDKGPILGDAAPTGLSPLTFSTRPEAEKKEAVPAAQESHYTSYHGDLDPREMELHWRSPILVGAAGAPEGRFAVQMEVVGENQVQAGKKAHLLPEKINGVLVRLPLLYRVTVTNLADEGQPAQSQLVLLPDRRHDYIFPMNQAFLSEDVTKVALVNGMIQGIESDRPGWLLGVIQIPKTILNSLLPNIVPVGF